MVADEKHWYIVFVQKPTLQPSPLILLQLERGIVSLSDLVVGIVSRDGSCKVEENQSQFLFFILTFNLSAVLEMQELPITWTDALLLC
jgi:hypothetical protein